MYKEENGRYELGAFLQTTTDKTINNLDVIENFNYGLVVGYDREMLPNLKLGIRYNFGMKDMTDNKLYKNNQQDFIRELNIRLTYVFE